MTTSNSISVKAIAPFVFGWQLTGRSQLADFLGNGRRACAKRLSLCPFVGVALAACKNGHGGKAGKHDPASQIHAAGSTVFASRT
jgi:hypothetical protein